VAKYNKQRARELQHDAFRDKTMSLFDKLAVRLEGRGKQILYGLGGIIVLVVLIVGLVRWNSRKGDEARQALGRGITISTSPVSTSPAAVGSGATYSSERERAQRAIEEFEKVAAKYGDPYKTEARYFIASNRLILDRPKAITELTELSASSVAEVGPLAKFALAQTKESDKQYDEAAKLYQDLVKLNSATITAETANLRLAKVYEKQGKKQEAADLLFSIVETARKAKGKDEKPIPSSSAAREAATELQKLDPDRYAKLPPDSPLLG
jgi:tetratricopeptide (TPR) repeat protein